MLLGLLAILCVAALAAALPQDMAKFRDLKNEPLATVISTCSVPNTVAMTFDDGPYTYIRDVDKVLREHNALGTFFFNGDNFRCIYSQESIDRVKYVYSQGHQVASHTWAHKNLTNLNADQIHDEMWRVEQALWRITGAYPAFTRPPYGEYNDLVRRVFAVRQQGLAMWDFDSQDTLGTTASDSMRLYDELITSHPDTALALNHEVINSTVYDVLPYALKKLRSAGYDLVTLAECLGTDPYLNVTLPQAPTEDWHC